MGIMVRQCPELPSWCLTLFGIHHQLTSTGWRPHVIPAAQVIAGGLVYAGYAIPVSDGPPEEDCARTRSIVRKSD